MMERGAGLLQAVRQNLGFVHPLCAGAAATDWYTCTPSLPVLTGAGLPPQLNPRVPIVHVTHDPGGAAAHPVHTPVANSAAIHPTGLLPCEALHRKSTLSPSVFSPNLDSSIVSPQLRVCESPIAQQVAGCSASIGLESGLQVLRQSAARHCCERALGFYAHRFGRLETDPRLRLLNPQFFPAHRLTWQSNPELQPARHFFFLSPACSFTFTHREPHPSPTEHHPPIDCERGRFARSRSKPLPVVGFGSDRLSASATATMDLPPAPTPPVNSGGMPSNADRTSSLLNLLKFSGNNAAAAAAAAGSGSQQSQPSAAAQQQQQQSPQQQHQAQPQHGHQPRQPSYGQSAQYQSTRLHQPAPTSADPTGLLAALMRGAQEPDEPRQAPVSHAPAQTHQPSTTFGAGSPSADTRSYLLNLLNRPKPSQTDQPLLTESARSNGPTPQSPDAAADVGRYFGQYQQPQQQSQPQSHASSAYQAAQQYQARHHDSESFAHVQHPASNVSSFSFAQTQESSTDMSAIYHQLMDSLNQSSPQSQQTHQSGGGASYHQALKKEHASPAGSQQYEQSHLGSERSPITSPQATLSLHQSIKQTPPAEFDTFGLPDKNKETVAEAVHDLAEKADRDAREALARAEQSLDQPDLAEGVEKTETRDDQEWTSETVRNVEKRIIDDIKKGQNKVEPPRYESPEPAYNESGAEAQAVADSWESADQEEIVVIEEKEAPPVRVYNFPMKPWISISLQEDATEPRPEFRDESIMDIARLKKEFDQIDRNLYTASQTYMTYGMSKQGGLRVIRQDDGKDAKVFTDTKDRIFNVAMSVTPTDNEGVQREAIIGTGISGTVYWVQIKDGEKDHIEDAHLEQYGFALPPMASHDGDTPGGVLKTRARASTIHPEYFAVGRGKSINFIWPSYILQNSLFKTGHDRVVDTETLLKQCSLKINTGKAGKDFTFSQDDTVVVSLDKSGRVKFWDVRDLTAVKEGSDPRAPVPAQTSLEVKEPLMTLASTPEGEKAWPTSVLLLDKQRPYQKRCALRYMIVGMKQNHTLQLWDLALGKPVQEFNLPHSKESDAVCSVMYHPASGMIVIGHPTRNSVYFAHLSAPKYNLKSVSQAEYIQRLVAQDSSIPQPDSTAVISGVREYSFANRGVIRSLDIPLHACHGPGRRRADVV
ncbi:hypothetical protein ACCO45_004734 [Purpureocillium lilacinum]|uniref:Uncharacterized protein n=1 Tax=Purpureocillium lilacinum TaxID=33203 RepID=A0ACC4DTD9_PURLI